MTVQSFASGKSPQQRRRKLALLAAQGAVASLVISGMTTGLATMASADAHNPDFGPNVTIFEPTQSSAQINGILQAASADMSGEINHWTTKRRAFFFKPGTYGSAAELNPALATDFINSEIGYYTSVAGLGLTPGEVQINGALHVEPEQICDTPWWCQGPGSLNNFWRSLSNMAIKPIQRPVDVTSPSPGSPTDTDIREGWVEPNSMRWAVSQAAPMRRVHIQGNLTYMGRYGAHASGGFTADSRIDGSVQTGSQQQFFHRESTIGEYNDPGVWNMVFSGTQGAPADDYPDSAIDADPIGQNKHANYGNTPISREAPFLTWNQSEGYGVFVPNARTNASGPSWSGSNPGAGTRISLNDFVVAKPGANGSIDVGALNSAIANGKHILFTPGEYLLTEPLSVNRAGTVVLGIGLATLRPLNGTAAIEVGDVSGVKLAGLMIEAHTTKSDVLVQVGPRHAQVSNPSDPTTLTDIFFRIGGAQDGNVDTALEVNSNHALMDNIWSWRADHGDDADVNIGYQWERNPADVGVRVNGDNVTALGLFVEHYQKVQTEWNGNNGRTIFYQSEIPYEPRTQAQHSDRGRDGYSSYKVDPSVVNHELFGAGVYSYYRWVDTVWAENGIWVPKRSTVKVNRAVTRWLNGCIPSLSASLGISGCTDGQGGGIRHIVNDQGGPAFAAGGDDANKTKWLRSYNPSGGDTTAPSLNANVSGSTLTASAQDNVTSSNKIHIDYKMSCGLWQPYTGSVNIPGDVENVWVRASDLAGNVSSQFHWSRNNVADDCQPGGGDNGGGDNGGGDNGGGDNGGGDNGGGDNGGGDNGGGDNGGGDNGNNCVEPWDGNKVYNQGDRVTLATLVYEAQWWTQGETPGTTGEWGVWRVVGVDTGCNPGGNNGGGNNGGDDDNPGGGDGDSNLGNGTGEIRVAGRNLCLDIPSNNQVDGNVLQVWNCNGTGAQNWTRNNSGEIRIGSKCVDVAYSGTANGTDVWLWNCNGSNAQQWEYNTATKTLRNPNSGKCLDIRDGFTNPSSGQKLQIWDCWGDVNQRWEF